MRMMDLQAGLAAARVEGDAGAVRLAVGAEGRHFHLLFFFFNDTATTEIYTLSLHDALPIFPVRRRRQGRPARPGGRGLDPPPRSEEHTSELQSHVNLVCRLLLEKKKKN